MFFSDLWFIIIQWEKEANSFSPIPEALLVGDKDPAVGECVLVREKGTRNIFDGKVVKKG